MKTLEDFTDEIKAKIPEYQAKCMDLSGTKENSIKYINRIYELAKEERPLVFFAKNPVEYRVLFELIPDILGGKSTQLSTSLYTSLDTSLSTSLDDSLSTRLRTRLRTSLDTSLSTSLDASLRKAKIRSYWAWYCSVYSRVYLTWYKFIQDEFKIKHELKDTLDELYELSINSNLSRCWFTKAYVLVLETPTDVKFNTNNQLHNVHGAAYTFNGEHPVYYVIGREISRDTFDKVTKKELTATEFFKFKNEEEKSAIIVMMQELHGDTYVFDFFKSVMSEVDSYVDKKDERYLEGTTRGMNVGVYTLFKGSVEGVDISYVRCYCPSTDRIFFLGVEPKYTTAKDAIASLYRVPVNLKNEIKYIQRQGERFSTVFTDEGTRKLHELKEDDLRNTTVISGDEYFSKMRYEY